MFSAKDLHRINPGRADDDIALLALHCHPEDADQPRRTDGPGGRRD
jgi:hypothetical protein